MRKDYDVIIDCYTDEPSGLGAPPYLSIHTRYLAGALKYINKDYLYINIDDLRYINGETNKYLDEQSSYNKRIINRTKNIVESKVLKDSRNIYVVMGCFVDYTYLSCEPPQISEVEELLRSIKHENIVLMYALGVNQSINIVQSNQKSVFRDVITGNFYNYIVDYKSDFFDPNYETLSVISKLSSDIHKFVKKDIIIEIESSVGCDRKPGCKFCIENVRGLPHTSRKVKDIVEEVTELYKVGFRYFRIGRQPNFYSFHNGSADKIEELLRQINHNCPDILTLHIDNVNPQSVFTENGDKISGLVAKYCTTGNIAPFGIESFDEKVRIVNNLNGTISQIFDSLRVINKYGSNLINGCRLYLPGINLIYGLEGEDVNSHLINMKYLSEILRENILVRRIFIRKLTSPYGNSLGDEGNGGDQFDEYKKEIETKFSLPMLKKVYPLGTVVENLRLEMYLCKDSILRNLGTCSERFIVKNNELKQGENYKGKVVGHLGPRKLEVVLVE
jgi:radical SAM superfamily enzyme with C-terminal helix-hairpin-helix motif